MHLTKYLTNLYLEDKKQTDFSKEEIHFQKVETDDTYGQNLRDCKFDHFNDQYKTFISNFSFISILTRNL